MNDIIKLDKRQIAGEEIQTVNARDLHEFLEVGRDFSNWIKDRIGEYVFNENEDYIVFAKIGENLPQGGRPAIEYHISLDMAKELAMVERTEKGRQARKYFIECENRLKAGSYTLPHLIDDSRYRELLNVARTDEVMVRVFGSKKKIFMRMGYNAQQAISHAGAATKKDTGIDVFERYGVPHLAGSTAIGIDEFVEECCVLGSGFTVHPPELFVAYRKWCEIQTLKAEGKNNFYQGLKAHFPNVARMRARDSSVEHFRGIALAKGGDV